MTTNTLKQLVESLVSQVLNEVSTTESYRMSADQNFDMSFEEWFASMGGMDEIIREFDIDVGDTYYWVKDEIEDENDEEAFEELAREELLTDLGNSFYDWASKWTSFEYPLELYRCVSLDSPESLKFDQLGISWSTDESSAECHWGYSLGTSNYTLVIEVGLDDIDQEATIGHNMHPSLGESEQEVTLLSGRRVMVKSIIPPGARWIDVEKPGVI